MIPDSISRKLNSIIHLLQHGFVVVDDYGMNVELSGIGQVGYLIYNHILTRVRDDYSDLDILMLSKTPFSSGQMFRWAFVTSVNILSHLNRKVIYIGLANPASYFPLAKQSHQVIYDVIPYELLTERRTLLYYAYFLPLRVASLLFAYANATVRLLIMMRTKSSVYSISFDSCEKIDSLIKPVYPAMCLKHILKDFVASLILNQSISSTSPNIQSLISTCSLYKNTILIHSTGEPRKGLHELLPMLCSLNSSLIVIYGKSWQGVGLKTIEKLLVRNYIYAHNKVVLLDSPSDSDVFALMRNFQLFIFPSRFEGYGLVPSVYFALTKKKPYVASTIVNKEILGDSAFMIGDWAELNPLLT